MGDLSTSLRALAHPGSVLALVLLVVNDHVLKQAWPGWVTGKLSDVAGLVVFPLLLAVPLAALRVRRSLGVAILLTAVGFGAVKASDLGAAVAGAVWSLGLPTTMRTDPTDLVALPALGLAWWIGRSVRRQPPPGWRRTVAVATGMALLPVAVLATAATNCMGDEGLGTVHAVAGRFTGTDARELFVVQGAPTGDVVLDPSGGGGDMADRDVRRLDWEGMQDSFSRLVDGDVAQVRCDASGMRCWRLRGERVVEISDDAGASWTDDLVVSQEDQGRSVEDVDTSCSVTPSARLMYLSVLGAGDGASVAVGARHAGVWLRDRGGQWRLVPRDELGGPLPVPASGATRRPPRGRLRFVVVWPRGTELDEPTPTPSPTRPCASPTTTTVTPDPLNGPPTTYEVCPTTPRPSGG